MRTRIGGWIIGLVLSLGMFWVLSSLLSETTLSGGKLSWLDWLGTVLIASIPLAVVACVEIGRKIWQRRREGESSRH